MYVRIVQFKLGPGQRAAAETVANAVVPPIRQQGGCQRCEFFMDDAAGDYGFFVLWDSQQSADAAAAIIGPILMAATREVGTAPDIRLYEVYEPM